MLQQSDIEDALACITGARLVGAHNFQLFDRHGSGHQHRPPAMPGYCAISRCGAQALVHSNHCLTTETVTRCRPRAAGTSQASSDARLGSGPQSLLAEGALTVEGLMAVT